MDVLDYHMTRAKAAEGEPDREFEVQSIVVLPGTELWDRYRTESVGMVHEFMTKVEKAPRDEIFPFLTLSNLWHLTPPAPSEMMQARVYERVLSCLDIEDHPGSKTQHENLLGDIHVNSKSHKLSYYAVHIVSQLQVVADDKGYGDFYGKLSWEQKKVLIFGSQNVSLVGLMGVLLQLKRTSSQLTDMKSHRSRSFLTEEPLPPAEEYRLRCTRYLEIGIIRILLNYMKKANEFGMIVANGSIESSDLWDSQSFRVLIWKA